MKNILITGANSYIGTSFEKWVKQWPDQYEVDTIDMVDGSWRKINFSGYDVVFHVAGIAHVDTRKATKETQEIYYKVNRDLTIETAIKAKKDGVKQFIFMSSIIVYGDNSPNGVQRIIDQNTIPKPTNFYGDSKLQAEKGIISLENDEFRVAILRPPMIYGKGSKGNYSKLADLARKCPIFPCFDNQRSMLHVDNLCEILRLIINGRERGTFYPQNKEYVTTTELVKEIASAHNKTVYTTKIFNPFIILLMSKIDSINKVFGNLVYDKELSNYMEYKYCINNFKQSIIKTEK